MTSVRELHFLNFSRIVPGYFSCAFDCFLEIWLRKIYTSFDSDINSVVIALLNQAERSYREIRVLQGASSSMLTLHALRSNIWDYVKTKCPSFVSMDCNAQFSELFRKELFADISNSEKNKIISVYSQRSFCNLCEKSISTHSEVLVNYISLVELINSRIKPDRWFEFISTSNSASKVACPTCERLYDVHECQSEMSEILFFEFSEGIMSICDFLSSISIFDNTYELVSLVKHIGSHFYSVVFQQGTWILLCCI